MENFSKIRIKEMKKIAIIGAGVSGLTTAQILKEKYIVKIYEKESTPGG